MQILNVFFKNRTLNHPASKAKETEPIFFVSKFGRLALSMALIGTVSACSNDYYLTYSGYGRGHMPAYRTSAQILQDQSIEYTANLNVGTLLEQANISKKRVQVYSMYNEVLVVGEVNRPEVKNAVMNIVKSMPNLQSTYDQIRITQTPRTPEQITQDEKITASILKHASQDPTLKAFLPKIKLVTFYGSVYTIGKIEATDLAAQNTLTNIIKTTEGAHTQESMIRLGSDHLHSQANPNVSTAGYYQ